MPQRVCFPVTGGNAVPAQRSGNSTSSEQLHLKVRPTMRRGNRPTEQLPVVKIKYAKSMDVPGAFRVTGVADFGSASWFSDCVLLHGCQPKFVAVLDPTSRVGTIWFKRQRQFRLKFWARA